MSRAALSLFAFGLYIFGLSVLLLVAPNVLLTTFGFSPTEEVWIRLAGMFLLFLAIYDILAARAELREFIRWSVPVRASVIVFFTTFVLLDLVQPTLVLFGFVDLAFVLWTAWALRTEPPRTAPRSS